MSGYSRKEKLLVEVLDMQEEKTHFHQDIELLYVLDGSINAWIDGKKTELKQDDVLIINANKQHYLKGTPGVLYVRMSLEYELVSGILGELNVLFWCDSTVGTDEAYNGLRQILQRMLRNHLSDRSNVARFTHIAYCYQIVAFLCEHFRIRTMDASESADRFDERISQIDNYIRANYASTISLKELADKLYLSNGYLSRFFKKHYGMSFAEYLTKVRLYHAVDELLYTDVPITRIVFDNGFSSVALFNRVFKAEYGETPSEVRKRSEKKPLAQKTVLTPENTEKLESLLWMEDDGKEDGTDAGQLDVLVSAKNRSLLKASWNAVINIGAASDLLRSEVQEHLIL